jgi:hypothetical protein
MIQAPKQESNYEPAPAGNHIARVYRVIHIGTAPEPYMGVMQDMNKILIGFELCDVKKEFTKEKGMEPMTISREFTLSMGKKSNLRKFIEGMYGVALQDEEAYSFDMTNMLGEACLLNVVHKTSSKGTVYALIQSAAPIPKGMAVQDMHNPAQNLDYEKFDEKLFESLPNFLKEKIAKTEEFKKMRGGINTDEIPFS